MPLFALHLLVYMLPCCGLIGMAESLGLQVAQHSSDQGASMRLLCHFTFDLCQAVLSLMGVSRCLVPPRRP